MQNTPVITLFSVLAVLLSTWSYVVVNRDVPNELQYPGVIRWMDAIGRVVDELIRLCHKLGVEPAAWPVKAVVNYGAWYLLNGAASKTSNVTVTLGRIDSVPVRIFVPESMIGGSETYPTMLYFHGGGWTWLNLDVYSGYLANLADKTQLQIIAVDYRQAPEYPYPAAFDDCLTVTKEILKRPKRWKIQEEKLLVGGDEAGGNLAAAISYKMKNKILMQLLINPVLQMIDFKTPSYRDNMDVLPGIASARRAVHVWFSYSGVTKDYIDLASENAHVSISVRNSLFGSYVDSEKYIPKYLEVTTRSTMKNFKSSFMASKPFENLLTNPTFSPMMIADVKSLPNAYVITSQYDVFRDEGIMFTTRLFKADVKVKLEHYKNSFHGFFLFSSPDSLVQFDVAKEALDKLSQFIDLQVHRNGQL